MNEYTLDYPVLDQCLDNESHTDLIDSIDVDTYNYELVSEVRELTTHTDYDQDIDQDDYEYQQSVYLDYTNGELCLD